MNKNDKKRITDIFRAKRAAKTEHAGHLAIEKVGMPAEDKPWYDEQIETIFWEIIALQDLEKEILGEE